MPHKDIHKLVVDLGYSMARLETMEAHGVGMPARPTLYILTPSCTEESSHAPAESVCIYGVEACEALRDLLTQGIALAKKGASAEPLVEAITDELLKKAQQ